jgi:hypothetical protein
MHALLTALDGPPSLGVWEGPAGPELRDGTGTTNAYSYSFISRHPPTHNQRAETSPVVLAQSSGLTSPSRDHPRYAPQPPQQTRLSSHLNLIHTAIMVYHRRTHKAGSPDLAQPEHHLQNRSYRPRTRTTHASKLSVNRVRHPLTITAPPSCRYAPSSCNTGQAPLLPPRRVRQSPTLGEHSGLGCAR